VLPPIGDLSLRHPRAYAGDEANRSDHSDDYGRRDAVHPCDCQRACNL